MATIQIEIIAGGDTFTVTKTITGAHLVRFIAAQKERLSLEDPVTDADIADAWARSVFKQARGEVHAFEHQLAVEVAGDGVEEIDLS